MCSLTHTQPNSQHAATCKSLSDERDREADRGASMMLDMPLGALNGALSQGKNWDSKGRKKTLKAAGL